MSSSLATIDDLPAEMIRELFKYLSLKDLTACSIVNKRWNSIYTDFRVDSLVVTYRSESEPDFSKWYNSNRRHSDSRKCPDKMFIRLLNRPLLSNLKHLSFCWYKPSEFDLNVLNKFSQLVHLELYADSQGKKVNLNLPMLNVLVIWHDDKLSLISVDCPRVKVLSYREGYPTPEQCKLEVKHPETIWKLDTNMFGPKLAPFKMVECLVTEIFQVISRDTLLSLPSLKELHFNKPIDAVLFPDYTILFDSLDRLKELLNEFLDDLQELKGPDFRFTFAGFQMTKWALKQMDFCIQENSQYPRIFNELVYMKNQDLIDPDASLDFVSCFDYSRLMQATGGEIPSWFFKRFTEIYRVETSAKIQDPEHFRWFLSSVRTLSVLDLENSELGQEFYDQLPTLAPQLTFLNLTDNEDVPNFELRLNFDFVDKLLQLESLFITQELPPELAARLIKKWLAGRLGHGSLYFRWRGNRVQIEKSKKIFKLYKNWSHKSVFKTENPDKILNCLEKLHAYQPRSERGLRLYLSQSVRWIRSHLVRNFRK